MALVGIVLAGGKSRRMGQDKSLLMHCDQSMLEFSCNLLSASGCESVIVSGPNKGQITDLLPEKGPLGGIYSCIQHYGPNDYLVVPVDMPLMSEQSLRELILTARRVNRSVYFKASPLPLLLKFDHQMMSWLARLLFRHDGDYSIKQLIKRVGAIAIKCPDKKVLFNTNTYDEWLQFQAISNITGIPKSTGEKVFYVSQYK